MRQVYVNGNYVVENEAKVSIFDRGFLFADSVYEVTSVNAGKLIAFPEHIVRLHQSLEKLKIPFSMTDTEILEAHRKLVQLNHLNDGLIYMQVTRGIADRDFLFPDPNTPNTVIMFSQNKSKNEDLASKKGIHIITMEDLRWQHCDIKTTQLLYSSMAKSQAVQHGADDAWLVKDGYITEGSSNNAYIVTDKNCIVTRHLSNAILAGITRASILACAHSLHLNVEQRPFTVEEAKNAKEAFITSATDFVNSVVKIDHTTIGDGKPGPTAKTLLEIYIKKNYASAL